jgi:hypothetical protein
MNRTLACPTDDSLKNLLKGNLTGPLVELLASHLENCPGCVKRAEQFRMEDEYAMLLRKEKERPLTAQEAQELAELRGRMLSLKETLTNATNPTLVNPNRDTPRELQAKGMKLSSTSTRTEAVASRGSSQTGLWIGIIVVLVVIAVAAGWLAFGR